MFKSLPITVRKVAATEARLEKIYEAARLGLKGDSLAWKSGLNPTEYRTLKELDPLVNAAEQMGRADAEAMAARALYQAAEAGDYKAALEILRHQFDWVAKQHIQMDHQISILAALEQANARVIDQNMKVVE
jgi:hypothetical protein